MAYTIAATPAELRSSAGTIEGNAASIRKEVEEVHQLLGTLRTTFLGKRASGFFHKYDQAYDDMQKWDDVVVSFAAELQLAAANLERADHS